MKIWKIPLILQRKNVPDNEEIHSVSHLRHYRVCGCKSQAGVMICNTMEPHSCMYCVVAQMLSK